MPIFGVFGGMAALVAIILILGASVRLLGKLLINALLGAVFLWILNLLGGPVGLYLPITWFSAVVAGFLGIPGVVLMMVLQAVV